MEDKVWYLAAAGKTVGPMSADRVLERLATGKVPRKTKAWKDGMAEWLPLGEVPEFAGAAEEVAVGAAALAEPARAAAAPARVGPPPAPRDATAIADPAAPPPVARAALAARGVWKNGTGGSHAARASRPASFLFSIFSTPEKLPLTYQQPHRIEKKDRWRAFGMGLDRSRVAFAVTMMFLSGVISAVMAGIGAGAFSAHPLLGLPVGLVAALVSLALPLFTVGGLSYQAREQLRGAPTPGVKETLAFARRNFAALGTVPFALSLATLVPFIGLALLSAFMKVPYAGPILGGLTYGAQLLLGATALFLLIAALLSWGLCPVIVGFEETSARGTIQVLFDFVKRSLLRTVLWGFLPALAFCLFIGVVFGIGASVAAIPLAINGLVIGGPAFLEGNLPAPLPEGMTIGLFPMAIWLGLLVAVLVGILMSTQNALISILYLGGRRGNDELITRDLYIARRAEAANN